MKLPRVILSVVLLVSAALGGYILATDSYLWAAAPTHAYGLGAFSALDIVLVLGLLVRPRISIILALLLGLVQLGAMAGDVFFGTLTLSASITTAAAFSKYLLGDRAFVTLLGVQVVLIIVALATFFDWRRDRRKSAPVRS